MFRRVLHILAFPSVPGLLHVDLYQYDQNKNMASKSAFRVEIRRGGTRGNSTVAEQSTLDDRYRAEAKLATARDDKYLIENLIAQLKMTECVIEDFVQLSLLVLMMLTFESETGAMSDVERKMLLDSVSFEMFILSAIVSLFSLVRGHMSLLFTNKNDFKNFKGSVITFTYFMVCISAR